MNGATVTMVFLRGMRDRFVPPDVKPEFGDDLLIVGQAAVGRSTASAKWGG